MELDVTNMLGECLRVPPVLTSYCNVKVPFSAGSGKKQRKERNA